MFSLFFGLSLAPFLFTKVMRVLIKYWREHSVAIACFIDDGLGVSKSFDMYMNQINFVRKSLILSGFVVNEEKSIWEPCQSLTWIGINVDLKTKL